MPSRKSPAVFEPIAPDWDLDALVEETPNFTYVDRISCDMIDSQGMDRFDKLILLHVVIGGKPLIIDQYHTRLDPWTFSAKWLEDNQGGTVESSTILTTKEVLPLTMKHYLKNMSKLTEQFFERDHPENYKEPNRQRVYLKDIDCPEVWQKKLQETLPPNLYYLNENTGEVGGAGSVDEPSPLGGRKKGKGIANAGDLMSSLPAQMRAQNLMCYIGHEGTYTPAHREMCASLGHNIMVEASTDRGEDGLERPGSSVWFMTESKDRHIVAEYWMSMLGHDIEVEKHFAQINAWKNAPFTTYIVDQRPGDLILIPPLAPHQVWNRGTRTMKVAWNRTTIETLEMAFEEALPNARVVCRDEQYKNKAIVFFTLKKYAALLAKARDQQQTAGSPQEAHAISSSPKVRQLQRDFRRLFRLFRDILLSEMFAPDITERKVEYHEFESNITCAYCRGNIFNRFLTCPSCDDMLGTTEPEPYDICMDCYAMGRSCGCISKLKWAEQFKWKELVHQYELCRRIYVELKGASNGDLPLPLTEERARLTHKTLAQICQEQLKRRPWTDVHKDAAKDVNEEPSDDNEEIEVDDNGVVKKPKKRRSEAWLNDNHACHVCSHRHPKWKMAECKCGRWFCYGTLFRGFDLMPQDVMADPNYQCPHCKGICSAGSCRKDSRQKPYGPKGTLLGHDTKLVADVRSVESLVDFRVSNLNWLKEEVKMPGENARLRKKQLEAEQAKLDGSVLYDLASDHEQADASQAEAGLIDPALGGGSSAIPVASMLNDARHDEYQKEVENSFLAPAAVMYYAPDLHDVDDEIYPHPNEVPTPLKKRSSDLVLEEDGIARRPLKKRRNDGDGKGVSGATKEFRKQQERRALEEARKNGRYISFTAALRGKQRVVKLSLPSHMLRRFKDIEAAADNGVNGATDDVEDNVLIRSDIVKPNLGAGRAKGASQAKASKPVRVRVERDADFRTRDRNRDGAAVAGPGGTRKKKLGQVDYEEFGDLSGEDGEEGGVQLDGAVETTDGGKKKRRISAWQAQKHSEDAADLEELPDHWKDSRRGRRNQQPRTDFPTPRKASAGKSVTQIRPTARRTEHTTKSVDGDDEENEENDEAEALRQEEEEQNRLAKLDAARLVESDLEEYDDIGHMDNTVDSPLFLASTPQDMVMFQRAGSSFVAANTNRTLPTASTTPTLGPSKAVAQYESGSAPMTNGESILSRGGLSGRKIKIVSKASRATLNGTLPSVLTKDNGKSSKLGSGATKSSPLPVKNVMSSNGKGVRGRV